MSAAVRALEKAGADFGDVRREDRTAFVVRVANEQIQSVNEVHRRGWGIRAFLDGAWGYASGTSGRTADLVQAARKAVAIAPSGATESRTRTAPIRTPTGRSSSRTPGVRACNGGRSASGSPARPSPEKATAARPPSTSRTAPWGGSW